MWAYYEMIYSLQHLPFELTAAELVGASSLSAKLNRRRVYSNDCQIAPSTLRHYLGCDRQPNDIAPAAEALGQNCSHTAGVIISAWVVYRTGG